MARSAGKYYLGLVFNFIMKRKQILLLLSAVSLAFPGVAISQISPYTPTLALTQQQQFTVEGGVAAKWWLQPATGMGTITQTGLYTAPAAIGNSAAEIFVYSQPVGGPIYYTVAYLSGSAALPPPSTAVYSAPPPPPPITGPSSFGFAPLNISVSVSPASINVKAGQSVMFMATVSGTNNPLVQWSLSPNIGSIANGVYTAPSSIPSSDTQVTVTATSEADSTKSATAAVMLATPVVPVSVSITPDATTLAAGQTVNFSASVSGTSNTGVSWSLNPSVGSMSNGSYTAPRSLGSQQNVTLTAVSQADPTKQATAALVLKPTSTPQPPAQATIGVSLSPTAVSLLGGQSATFTPTITGSSNTAVSWSLSPQVGSITNGVYHAPAVIASQQTVTITATSQASTSKTATATVTLTPVGITVGPASVTIAPGASTTFTASVTGASNTAVMWTLSRPEGSIVNGMYTAPATVTSPQSVTITATSVANTAMTANATVNLTVTPSNPTPTNTTATLPVEVMGAAGTTVSASVVVPSGSNVSGALQLYLQLHGVKYDSEASVRVNNSPWMNLSTGSVKLLGNAAAFGGIGGEFTTLQMTVNLPAGAVVVGTNTITFRFNQTNGVISGYRVLAMNFQSAGTNLIPASQFVQDDPNGWQPPSTAASDIAAGQSLYQGAALTVPNGSGGWQSIKAHCSDCHTLDGRDLKYFNYSNNSIEVRATFHGLTAQQGQQIASYIRSLNVPNPGRPWNPPYQPGPGLDSQPVANWAAGAGVEAILDNDSDMFQYLAPGGSTAGWAANAYLNMRELPLTFPLPDWNSWLPIIHPMDAFGATFTSSPLANDYLKVHNQFSSSSNIYQAYANAPNNIFANLYQDEANFNSAINVNAVSNWTPALRQGYYSVGLWMMVKLWEMNQDFGLEGIPQAVFGSKANPRAWYSSMPFDASPNMEHIPYGAGMGNGSQVYLDSTSLGWYQLQLILNDGQGTQVDHTPIDYGYLGAFVQNVFVLEAKLPAGMLQMADLVKASQEYTLSGRAPSSPLGWNPVSTSPMELVNFNNFPVWNGYSASTMATLFTAYTQIWFGQASQFSASQWYQGGWATATESPVSDTYGGTFAGEIWYMLPRLRYEGVPTSLTTQISNWAAKIWPAGNWSLNNSAACNQLDGFLWSCTAGSVDVF
jgi:hypothetical protein